MQRTKSSWNSWWAIVVGFVAVTLGGFQNTAWSEDLPPPQSLEQRVNALDQEVKTLHEQIEAGKKAHASRLTAPGEPNRQSNEPAGQATAGRSGFALQSDDGDYVLRFGGLIQVDGRFYIGNGADSDAYSPAVIAAGQATSSSQFLLRRVRPIFQGTFYHTFDFFIQPDFGQNTAAIYDAYLDIKPANYANLRAGKFKPPLGLERLQTDSYLTFAERGLTSDLQPQRDTGIQFYGGFFANALTYQVAFTNGVADGAFQPDSDSNNSKQGTFRIFALPFKTTVIQPFQRLGLGVAGSYTGDNALLPTYKTASGQSQFFSYTSGVIFNGEQSRLNPELNYYWGSFGTYGEYTETHQVAQKGALKTRLSNKAWQSAAAWVLTGEDASYTGVIPQKDFNLNAGTWGAWEIAARFHQLQLDPEIFRLGFADPTLSVSRATAYTVGVNWYLNKFVKFVADYEQTWFKGGNGTGDRPTERVFGSRWQIAF